MPILNRIKRESLYVCSMNLLLYYNFFILTTLNFSGELGNARVDKHEETRRKKKQEIVENFKRVFPGVYDRLINMAQPIHKKYNVAITKQLGRYMEAIVVDSG